MNPERADRRNEVKRRIQTPTTKPPNFYENSDGRKKIAILTTDADSTQCRERGSFTLPQSFFFFSYLFPHPSETNREALWGGWEMQRARYSHPQNTQNRVKLHEIKTDPGRFWASRASAVAHSASKSTRNRNWGARNGSKSSADRLPFSLSLSREAHANPKPRVSSFFLPV